MISSFLSDTVLNKGSTEETTAAGLERLNAIFQKNEPKKILIMEGTYDINFGRSLSTIAFNLEEMVINSIRFGATPYVGTLAGSPLYNERTHLLNQKIMDFSKKTNTSYADTNEFMRKEDFVFSYTDPLHPNDKGYEAIAYAFYLSLFSSNALSSQEK